MVILLSGRKNKYEEEIIEILTACGADFISDRIIAATGGSFTVTSIRRPTRLDIKKGIILMLDDTSKFQDQIIPCGVTGICEDCNTNGLILFKKNNIPVITCGNNPKNTVTVSSINDNNIVAALQRTIVDCNNENVYPGDFKIKLSRQYSHFSIMSSLAVLLIKGITPNEF